MGPSAIRIAGARRKLRRLGHEVVDIGDCQWTEGFWGDKYRLCEQVMVPHMGTLLKGDIGHAYNNFKIAAGLKDGEHQGTNWHDGDFYKFLEAASATLAVSEDDALTEWIDRSIDAWPASDW